MTILAYKGCKIAAQKKIGFSANFALLSGLFCIGATIRIDQEMLCLPYAGFFFQTPERAKNIEDKVFFRALMSQEGDVEKDMPLGEGQDNSELWCQFNQ